MEVDINGIKHQLTLDRTDVEFSIKFFLNPYWWLRFKVLYHKGSEWGIIIGPVQLVVFFVKVYIIEDEDRPN